MVKRGVCSSPSHVVCVHLHPTFGVNVQLTSISEPFVRLAVHVGNYDNNNNKNHMITLSELGWLPPFPFLMLGLEVACIPCGRFQRYILASTESGSALSNCCVGISLSLSLILGSRLCAT